MDAELSFRSVCGELTFCGKSDACFLHWQVRLSLWRILPPWPTTQFHGYHLGEFLRPPGQDVVVAQVVTSAVPRLFARGGKFFEESDAHPIAGYSSSTPTSSAHLQQLVDRTLTVFRGVCIYGTGISVIDHCFYTSGCNFCDTIE